MTEKPGVGGRQQKEGMGGDKGSKLNEGRKMIL
jgi:hypothetical protein